MPASPAPGAQPPCPKCGHVADPAAGAVNYCPACGEDLRAAPAAAADLPPEAVIAERYRLIAPIGQGGMGAVYRAEHIVMGKAVALKLLRGEFARAPGAAARFRAEAQIVSRLSHPHTIAVFDFGEIGAGEGLYLAMEYVPGLDLAALLRRDGRLSEARAAELGRQVLGALGEAHDAGIVHRDVKPANVMVMRTREGGDFVKVLDFGIARWCEAPGAGTTTTSAGIIVGTPSYLSPEQARGDSLDARADLYSVGALLYELVAGRPPFVAPNPLAVVAAHLHEAPPPLAQLAPGVSPRFAAVVHRALAKRPSDRFANADEMAEALARPGRPAARRARVPAAPAPGALDLAVRDDFRELDHRLRPLRRGRSAAPLAVALVLGAAALSAWKWPALFAALELRAPALAARIPAPLRPPSPFDGREHEPDDTPARATPLPLGGTAPTAVRGRIGGRLADGTPDVDVYRLEVPAEAAGAGLLLHAALAAEEGGDGKAARGIPGVDAVLTLNRAPAPGLASAPLVATADRGGPGAAEALAAPVEPGTYFLAVRERRPDGAAPVEKPEGDYVLTVRLGPKTAGEEAAPDAEGGGSPEPGPDAGGGSGAEGGSGTAGPAGAEGAAPADDRTGGAR